MRIVLTAAAAALIAAGCAGGGSPGGPTTDTGTIVGEVGDPRNRAKLHTELAALYYSRGSMAIALEELRVAIAADERYPTAHGMLAVVYQGLRENSLAEQSFGRALELAPNDSDINHNFGWYLCENERADESIKYFLHAIRNPLYRTPWRSYSAAGQCSLRLKKVGQAEQFFERALKLDPDDLPSILQMGQIRYGQGRMSEARQLVTQYNKLASPTAESLWLALRVERKLGQRVAETRFATQLRRRFPGSSEYHALQRGDFE
jgi:type IV pilus assembly protein PilF